MSKDRFVAFFDAIMAIIMTIVVLEFVIPGGTQWSDLGVLGYQILAYGISFFWLAGMWVSIHNIWHDVKTIDKNVLWTNITMVFFASMLPFFVVYLGRNIHSLVPQLLYGLDVFCITALNYLSVEFLARHHGCVKSQMRPFRISMAIDFGINIVGIIIGVVAFPIAIMISVALSRLFLVIWRNVVGKKNQKTASADEVQQDGQDIQEELKEEKDGE